MSKLQTLKRARQDACIPNVQGRLAIRFPDEGDDGDGEYAPASAVDRTKGLSDSRSEFRAPSWSSRGPKTAAAHPPAYRKIIAGWTVDWRERWGYRANSLEEIGLAWRDAETQAFVEILNQIRETADPSSGHDPTGLL